MDTDKEGSVSLSTPEEMEFRNFFPGVLPLTFTVWDVHALREGVNKARRQASERASNMGNETKDERDAAQGLQRSARNASLIITALDEIAPPEIVLSTSESDVIGLPDHETGADIAPIAEPGPRTSAPRGRSEPSPYL